MDDHVHLWHRIPSLRVAVGCRIRQQAPCCCRRMNRPSPVWHSPWKPPDPSPVGSTGDLHGHAGRAARRSGELPNPPGVELPLL